MQITVTIDTENDAFGETVESAAQEVQRILSGISKRDVATALCDFDVVLHDKNGNAIGALSTPAFEVKR